MEPDQDHKKYEITFVLGKESDYDKIKEALIRRGAENIKNPGLVRIKLAYPVKKESFGFWGFTDFEAKPESVQEIKSDLKTVSEVLRLAILNAPPAVKTASIKTRTRPAALLEDRPKLMEKKVIRDQKPVESKKEAEAHKPSKPPFEGELSNKDLEQKLEEILNQ